MNIQGDLMSHETHSTNEQGNRESSNPESNKKEEKRESGTTSTEIVIDIGSDGEIVEEETQSDTALSKDHNSGQPQMESSLTNSQVDFNENALDTSSFNKMPLTTEERSIDSQSLKVNQ